MSICCTFVQMDMGICAGSFAFAIQKSPSKLSETVNCTPYVQLLKQLRIRLLFLFNQWINRFWNWIDFFCSDGYRICVNVYIFTSSIYAFRNWLPIMQRLRTRLLVNKITEQVASSTNCVTTAPQVCVRHALHSLGNWIIWLGKQRPRWPLAQPE